MDLILIIIVLLLLFGGGFGYSRYGYRGGIGIGGVLLIILILYLLLGHGRIDFKGSLSFVFGVPHVDDRVDSSGVSAGLIASKILSTTREGTVVDILLGIVGPVIGGWLFAQFNGSGVTGFDIDSVYSAGIPQ